MKALKTMKEYTHNLVFQHYGDENSHAAALDISIWKEEDSSTWSWEIKTLKESWGGQDYPHHKAAQEACVEELTGLVGTDLFKGWDPYPVYPQWA